MPQFHDVPSAYLDRMRAAVPLYDRIQDEVATATVGVAAKHVLDLGTGTGETAKRVLAVHPEATLVGIDARTEMVAAARIALRSRGADIRSGRLEDELPAGPYDLVVSALAVHHLGDRQKADLFRRVAVVLRPGGRFVMADVVVPEDPEDAVTPIDERVDLPSTVADQLDWLAEARLEARVSWAERDLAVIVANRND